MKPASLKEINEAVFTLNYLAENIGKDNLDETKEDIRRAISFIKSAIFIETVSASKKFNLYNFTANDKLRPAMEGVYHDKGYKVATDSHILVAVKEQYQEDLEGVILDKRGERIRDYKYPKWDVLWVQPGSRAMEDKKTFTIDTDKVREVARVEKAEKKAAGKNGPHRRALVKAGDVYFNAAQMEKLCAFMDAYGAKELNTYGRRGAEIIAPDGSKAIIMPMVYFGYHENKQITCAEMHEQHHDDAIWYEVA